MAITFLIGGITQSGATSVTFEHHDERYVCNDEFGWELLGYSHTDLARAIGNGLAFGPGDMAR